MPTPYITPDILQSAPTGISWNTIPVPRADPRVNLEELTRICNRASSLCDLAANQPLRATLDSENLSGPDFRVTLNNHTGITRVQLSRWPVLAIISAQVSASTSFPRQWRDIAADQLDFEYSPIGQQG